MKNYKDSLNLLDIKSYLPDDILVKTNGATMTYGLGEGSIFNW